MDARTRQIMARDPYTLQLSPHVGEAVSRYLKYRHPANTAKLVARQAGIDPRTADNILDGHLSATTCTKLFVAYGWDLISCIGTAVTGVTYEQSINNELEAIAHARRELDEAEGRSRAAWEALRARRSVGDSGLRLVPEIDTDPVRPDRSEGRGVGVKEVG